MLRRNRFALGRACGEHLKKGKNAMTTQFHPQTAKFISALAQNVPILSSKQMQEWIDDPKKLQAALAVLERGGAEAPGQPFLGNRQVINLSERSGMLTTSE